MKNRLTSGGWGSAFLPLSANAGAFFFSEDGKETIWRRDFCQAVFGDLVLVTIVGRAGPKGRPATIWHDRCCY